MGCWYETCGLSGLPIPPRTKSLLFLLAPGLSRDDGRSGFCYPTDRWAPLLLPIRGEYDDDRGTITLPKEAPAHWALSAELLEDTRPTWRDGRYEKEWQPLQVAFDEECFRPIERGWVDGVGYRGKAADRRFPIGQVLIREDVWNGLLTTTHDAGWGATSRLDNHTDARKYVQSIKENPPSSMTDGFAMEQRFLLDNESPSTFFRSIFGRGEIGTTLAPYRSRLTRQLVDKLVDEETALNIFYEMGDLAHVNQLMSHLRRAWRPQPGKGSQDIEWELHGRFADAVRQIASDAHDEAEDE